MPNLFRMTIIYFGESEFGEIESYERFLFEKIKLQFQALNFHYIALNYFIFFIYFLINALFDGSCCIDIIEHL